jgi:phosphoribosylformylglycinamidine synthase subunit PurQ / glutaminase
MPQPRVLILRAPGTNCDLETAFAFERAGGRPERIHVNRLLESGNLLADFQILCLPGGFSYGDDIAAGRILGTQIQHRLADGCQQFKAAEKLILGICNGFQILMKTGILLAPEANVAAQKSSVRATLTWNQSGRFEDRWVHLDCAGSKAVIFAGIETMYLPVAHAEGKFVTRDAAVLADLERQGQVALRYRTQNGSSEVPYPANPNGAVANIAGICDPTGRVCGLMPHPERHIDATQHPQWTRGPRAAVGDGLRVFQNAVGYFQ